MRSRIFVEVVTFLLIVLFFYTGVSKLVDHGTFVAHIEQSLVLQDMAGVVGVFIPASEVLLALALAIPRYRGGALYCAVFILFVFTIYIVLILGISAKLPCACGGVVSWMGWREHLVFNIIFLLLAGVATWIHERKQKDSINTFHSS